MTALPPGRRIAGTIPGDLALVVGWVLLSDLVVVLTPPEAILVRSLLVFPFVLVLPGYALIAVVFPERSDPRTSDDSPPGANHSNRYRRAGITMVERFCLSVGFSIVLTALMGISLDLASLGIRLIPALAGLSLLTLVLSAVAVARRRALSPLERFSLPVPATSEAMGWIGIRQSDRTDTALNLLLAVAVVLSASGIVYAIAVPDREAAFTSFYLLNRDDGSLNADTYPTAIESGGERELVVGIENHEIEDTDYTVVVQLQRTTSRDDPTVIERIELDRLHVTVPRGEVSHRDYVLSPPVSGSDFRVAFLLYRDTPPNDPTIPNAYRETHLWINVTAAP